MQNVRELVRLQAAAVVDFDAQLAAEGAILLTDASVTDARSFEAFVSGHLREWMGYVDRASRRSSVQGRILTSTDTPPAFAIPLHCESSFTARWPQRIFFYCHVAAQAGGRTPVADMRRVYEQLDPEVRDRFERHGVMYYRNFGKGVGMDWREVFQQPDRESLERYCALEGIRTEWLDEDRLRTVQVRPASVVHPRTGERVWFNHALALHVTSLDAALRETLLRQVGEAGLPHNTYFGDGEPIPDHVIAHVREVHARNQRVFDWRPGDVLVLDNMRMAHGREPYCGERAVHAAMGDPLTWRELGYAITVPVGGPRFAGAASAPAEVPKCGAECADDLSSWFLATVARELGLAAVDAGEGFADLGGDSMAGVMLIDELLDRFGVDLALEALMESTTLGDVIRLAEGLRSSASV